MTGTARRISRSTSERGLQIRKCTSMPPRSLTESSAKNNCLRGCFAANACSAFIITLNRTEWVCGQSALGNAGIAVWPSSPSARLVQGLKPVQKDCTAPSMRQKTHLCGKTYTSALDNPSSLGPRLEARSREAARRLARGLVTENT